MLQFDTPLPLRIAKDSPFDEYSDSFSNELCQTLDTQNTNAFKNTHELEDIHDSRDSEFESSPLRNASNKNTKPENEMGLKQKEKMLDELKKENFGLKMRIYYLQETLQSLTPEMQDQVLSQFAELKAVVEEYKMENAQLNKELNESNAEIMQLHNHPWLNRPECVEVHVQTDVYNDSTVLMEQLESKLADTTKEATHLAQLFDGKRMECQDLNFTLAHSLESNRELMLKVECFETEKKEFETKLRLEITKVKEQLDSCLLEKEDLEKDLESRTSELKICLEKTRELENLFEIQKLEMGSEIETKWMKKMEEVQIQSLELEVKSNEIESLKENLHQYEAQMEEMDQKYQIELHALNSQLEKVEQSEPTVKELRAQLENALDLIERMRLELEERTVHELETKESVPEEKIETVTDDQILIRNRYLTELKERNTCLVTINQKLDHFIKTDNSQIKNFAELKSTIYSKLSLILKDWKKMIKSEPQDLKNERLNAEKRVNELLFDKQTLEMQLKTLSDKNQKLLEENTLINLKQVVHYDENENQRLRDDLNAKTVALHEQTRRLKNAKEQYADLVNSHQKKGKIIQEALARLSNLSHADSASIEACFK